MGIYDRDYMRSERKAARRNEKPPPGEPPWLMPAICTGVVVLILFSFNTGNSRALPASSLDRKGEPLTLAETRDVPLGRFQVQSGHVVVSDPGDDLQTVQEGQFATLVSGARAGNWEAVSVRKRFVDHGTYVAELVAVHEIPWRDLPWRKLDVSIGLEAAQAGFFDFPQFQNDESIPKDVIWSRREGPVLPDALWYSYCLEVESTLGAGVLPGGVVSRAGRGDGDYNLFTFKDESGLVTGFRLVFVSDEG